MMGKLLRRPVWLMVGLWMALGPPGSHASGFGVFTHGADAMENQMPLRPTIIFFQRFFNPALINALPGTQIEIGTTVIAPHWRSLIEAPLT